MQVLVLAVLLVAGLLVGLAAVTRVGAWHIERRHPPVGEFATVNDTRMHYVLRKGGDDADLPPVMFLHGASGNLKDQMTAFADRLAGRADLLFVDRPGHGWSGRGPAANELPDGQAATLAALLDELGIDKAIVVGHSFGGAVAASFALFQPGKTVGTVFLAPVSHPWPGGVDWYYDLTPMPVIGPLFAATLALPAGLLRIGPGTAGVFTPNKPPANYAEETGVALVLRPAHFRANATDISLLLDYLKRVSPLYSRIETPTVIVTGDCDAIVLPRIHSIGLKRDIDRSELVWIRNLGHKPDYVATDIAVAAMEKIAGLPRDLQAMARALENRIADDRHGPVERCLDNGDAAPDRRIVPGDQMPESPSEPI